jgi:hypothetical protein
VGIFSNIATRIVIFLLVGGAVAVGGFLLRERTSGHVNDLQLGDCFDVPTGVETIGDVQHHPCKEAHNAEVVGLFVYPYKSGDPYPSTEALHNYAESQCVAVFRSYTGRDPITDPLLSLGWMYPAADGWSQGDHGLNCYLARADDGQMTQSYRIGAT